MTASYLCAALAGLNFAPNSEEALAHDAEYIIDEYALGATGLDPTCIMARAHMFDSASELYSRLLQHILRLSMTHELLEMMPLVDEYIEWVFNIE